MKRDHSRSPHDDGSSPKRPRTDAMDEQRYFFQFQDGRLVESRDDAGAAMDVGLVCDLDAIHRLAQQTFPVGHVTITLDQAAILNDGLAHTAAAEKHSSAPPSSPFSTPSAPDFLPASSKNGMEGLLVCQPVAAVLLSALHFKDWIKLRGVARCWRDAVDLRLRSLKTLNVFDFVEHAGVKEDEKKAISLLKFMSGKAPAIQSLVVGNSISACPEVLKRFVKLKQVDMEGATWNQKLFDVLEELPTLETWETVSLPSEPGIWGDRFFREYFRDRFRLLIGRLCSLKTLTIATFDEHPALLRHLTNPEKMTRRLTIRSDCPLPSLQSLSRFVNLQNLAIICLGNEEERAALESALKQLKALRRLDLGRSRLSAACIQNLAQMPLLKRLSTTHGSLPEGVHWSQLSQLSFLELGAVRETFIPCINQIPTLRQLKLGAEDRVKFSCSLPQLDTLRFSYSEEGSFQLDLQPTCCNLKNLTLYISHYRLTYLAPGLLNHNPGLKTLRIGWTMTGGQSVLRKVKSMAQACQGVETLVFSRLSRRESVEGLMEAAAVFVARCPTLKNLRASEAYLAALKAKKEFAHLNISVCSSKSNSWMLDD